jgi:HSP20 family protein
MLTIRYTKVTHISGTSRQAGAGDPGASFSPPVDISYHDYIFTVRMDIPGVTSEDIVIEAWEYELAIFGVVPVKNKPGPCRLMERRGGPFRRVLTFPGKIKTDGIEANLTDGVLTIRIPVPDLDENPTEHKIKVQGAD